MNAHRGSALVKDSSGRSVITVSSLATRPLSRHGWSGAGHRQRRICGGSGIASDGRAAPESAIRRPPSRVWDGVYTEEQAERGKELYCDALPGVPRRVAGRERPGSPAHRPGLRGELERREHGRHARPDADHDADEQARNAVAAADRRRARVRAEREQAARPATSSSRARVELLNQIKFLATKPSSDLTSGPKAIERQP